MASIFDPGSTERELRQWCVNLTGGDVRRAQIVLDFVTGASDKTPAEKLRDALAEVGITLDR